TDQEFVRRFEEEASVVASLRHPNIVQVFDFNTDLGNNYMVMEYVPGETLQDRLKRLNESNRRMSLEEALKITIDICEALSYAHKRGMVHRDIKPANIMLDVTNQAILMDFGIVKIIGGQMHTVTGAVMGTARYMPPEVVRSEPADQRSDIYALGITLYEMLSGKPPFEADSVMTVMMMHLNDPVPDIRPLRADLDPQLVPVLMKALAKDRNQRFASADEFSTTLKRILHGLENKTGIAHENQPTIFPAAVSVPSQPVVTPENRIEQSGQFNPPSRPNPIPVPMGDHNTVYDSPVRTSTSGSNPNMHVHPVPNLAPERQKQKSRRWMWIAGIGGAAFLLLLGVVVVGGILFSQMRDRQTVEVTETESVPLVLQTENANVSSASLVEATNTLAATRVIPTATSQPSATFAPTEVPTTPTPTYPPLYVKINEITLTSSNQYSVAYETFGFTEVLPGQHIHFFFDTVTPENAGMPGSGPWILYGGPRPFTGYSVYQKPKDATQMCALVANSNHTIILESGNCLDLPAN
ncbi:MAG: serine/threonine protein kinase, partial [Anaerolineaceae bacterium]|nr:serine/threonine protein kinase [Anaerolineaceae bacterium]